MWLLLRLRPRMRVCNCTTSSTCYRNASCTMTPTRSSISANPASPNLNWVITLAISPTNWEANTSRASGGPKNYCYKTSGGKTEVKVRGITLDCTARQKVNFEVICAMVFLRAECGVTGQVSVDIPFRITRNTRTKEIQTKRKKKDYRVVYNKSVIIDDYKTLPYGY